MASYQKRGKGWRAIIRRKGNQTMTRQFRFKADARIWARQIESRIDRGNAHGVCSARKVTMAELFRRYAVATRDTKRNAPHEKYTLRMLEQHLGQIKLADLSPMDVADFRDKRKSKNLANSTVVNNLHLLSAVIKLAMTEWGYDIPFNSVQKVRKLEVRNTRDRRLEVGEEERLLAAAKEMGGIERWALVVLGIATAMRIGEMLSLTWERIDLAKREAYLPDTKNKDVRRVPLSKRAVEALEALEPKESGKVIARWKDCHSFVRPWRNLTKKAGIVNLRFHDLRHEATSRMAEAGMSILKISAITGHRSFQMLKRYTHIDTRMLACELDEIENSRGGKESEPYRILELGDALRLLLGSGDGRGQDNHRLNVRVKVPASALGDESEN